MSKDFETWDARTRIALAMRDVNHLTADPLIEAARAHWESSGLPPEEALGTPAEFAEAAAAEQPAAARARQDREGQTPGDYLSGSIFALALIAVPHSLLLALAYGTMGVDLTPARLVAAGLFLIAFACMYAVPHALRASGRPHLAPWVYVPAFAAMALTAIAAVVLPHTRLITVNVLVLDAVAVFVAWLTIRPAKPSDPSPESRLRSAPADPEAWFEQLDGLLVGRHDLPPARAAELVGQARSHLAGASPAEEFGPIEVYAAELAEPETTHHVPFWHRQAFRNLVFLAFGAVLIRDLLLN